jgi:hypothetical protein
MSCFWVKFEKAYHLLPVTLPLLTHLHCLLCCVVPCLQHIEGYCAAPHSVCFSSAVLDDSPLAPELLAEPTRIALPRTGLLKVRASCKQPCCALMVERKKRPMRNDLGCSARTACITFVTHRPAECSHASSAHSIDAAYRCQANRLCGSAAPSRGGVWHLPCRRCALRTGRCAVQVCFVDLRPVPAEAAPLSAEGFAVQVGVLLASSHLDARALAEAVDDVDVKTKVRTCPMQCTAAAAVACACPQQAVRALIGREVGLLRCVINKLASCCLDVIRLLGAADFVHTACR